MICGTCRHANQPTAKFCSECGTALALGCPSCGKVAAPAAKFCDACGASLSASPAASAAAVGPGATRKLVTALFADLAGSTSFAERVDDEAVRSTLAGYFTMLRSTIEDHAGSVVKFLGDGMLALFGVPEVAEDDALRAVAAGVELQRRFRSFAIEVRERHGVDLGLRVGINTGELVIGADDADLVGDVLNTAARIEAACAPGRVLVGEETWRLTRANAAYEVLEEVRVKGKADALPTFQVVERDDGGVGRRDEVSVFVGRSDELDALRALFADAVATSAARLATLIGPPGVGKTRLARELCARTDARSFDLRLERRGATTFSPIVDLLRAAAGSASIEAIELLLTDHPERDRLPPVLASFLGQGEARTVEESFWAVRRLLELLAADGPVIVVIDDIQWAEPLFWDLLEHLVEWTAAPVLLLALARPELRDLRPELTQPGRRVATTLAMEGLDPDTTRELAARLLGIDALPADLAERLPESTDGNPLFVRELMQMLVDDGVLAPDGERWHLTIDADAIEVPPTILSLLASRVERLPDDERQVVELASVIGTEFDRGTLAAIANSTIVGRLGAVIDRLRRKDLVEPSGQWFGDHPVYRFHHVLIRDAAYRRLLKAHRAELHELVGRHVESSRVADDDADVIVAHHFERVYRYRSDLGALDEHTRVLATTAAARLRSAAESALDREDLSSAGSAAIRALHLLPLDAGAPRDELLLIGCEALLSSGDAAQASPLVDELHERSADERLSAWADCFRAQAWSLTDAERVTEAAEVTAGAADRLARIGDDAGVAKARLVRASCLARLGRVGECEAELDLALSAARAAGDRRRTVAVLGAAPLAALWGPSPVARAGGRCLDVLRLLRITSASPAVEATSIRCQGVLEALRGRFDSARAKLDTSRTTARDLGLRHALYETELFAGIVELFAGDPAAAEPHLRAARDGLGRLGIGADAGQAAALLASSVLLQGRVAEADQLATAALETAGQNLQTAITAAAALAEVRAAQGRHDEARRFADDAISIASPTDVTLDHALALLAAARVAASASDATTSQRRAAQAAELLDAKGVDAAISSATPLVATDEWTARADASTPDTPGRNQPGRPFTNRAWELGLLADNAFFQDAGADPKGMFSPDFVAVWHHRLADGGAVEVTRDEFLDVSAEVGGDELVERATELLAIRGEELALVRATNVYPAARTVAYVILEADDQRLTRLDRFDDDQLTDAIEELDRRWLAGCGLPADAFVVAAWSKVNTLQAGDLSSIVHADFEFTDHRSLHIDTDGVSFDEFVRRGWAEADTWALVTEVHRFEESGTVFTRVERNRDDEICIVMVAEEADGALRRLDIFDPHDLDAALGLFDGRQSGTFRSVPAGSVPAPNRAYRIADEFGRAVIAGDRDTMLLLLAEEFEIDHRGPAQLALGLAAPDGGAAFIDRALTTAAHEGATSLTRTLVASRGDDLYLAMSSLTTVTGDQLLNYALGEGDGHRLRRVTYFDESQLDDAMAELDRRYRLSCGIGDDHWVARKWRSLTSLDADLFDEVLAPDFRSVEHRAGQLGVIDRAAVIEWVRATPPSTRWSIPVIHRLSDRGMVVERLETWANDTGAIRALGVIEFGDGVNNRFDVYEPDDLDAALARYDEIVGAVHQELTNRAWELVQRSEAIRRRGDRNGFRALLADGFVVITHDPIMQAIDEHRGVYDKERYLDTAFNPLVFGPTFTTTQDLIAVRGDDLCLLRNRTITPEGDVYEPFVVSEIHDGLFVRSDVFPHDQLREAQIALDQRWFATLGFDADDWFVRHWDLAYSMSFDDLGVILHPDFEYFDHRPLPFPSGDAASLADTMGSIRHEVDVINPRIHCISRAGSVVERIERAVGDVLGEDHQIMVTQIIDDAIRRTDSYSVDDLRAALARYDEITGAAREELTNGAWKLVQRGEAIRQRGDRDAYGALLADDFVAIAHDQIMKAIDDDRGAFDKGQYLVALFDPLVLGPTFTTELDLVAVRGDNLCLLRTRTTTPEGDLLHERLMAVETRDGLFVRIDAFQYDQLRAAQIELDHRWMTSLGFAEDHPWFALTALFYDDDPTAFPSAFSEQFGYDDHRRLTFPDGDFGQLLVNAGTRLADLEVIIRRYLRLTDRIALGERIEQTVGGADQMPGLYLIALGADGRISYMEIFDIDDEEAAIAAFDRQLAEAPADEPESVAPFAARRAPASVTNRASEIAAAFLAGFEHGDFRTVSHLYDPDGVVTLHIQFRVMETSTMQDSIDAVMSSRSEVSAGRIDLGVVAVRDEQFCLVDVDSWYDDDNLRMLAVIETDDERIVSMAWFDPDQLVQAQLDLDRRWRESTGQAGHWFTSIWHLLYDPHPDAMFEFLTPDFEYIDHRPLMFPSGNADVARSNIASMQHDVVFTIPRIHRMSDAGGVFERLETAVDELAQTHVVFVNHFVDERVRAIEAFDITQLDEALARYDEFSSD